MIARSRRSGGFATEAFCCVSCPARYIRPGLGKNVEYRNSARAKAGRITQRKDWVLGEEVSYAYDTLGRLPVLERR